MVRLSAAEIELVLDVSASTLAHLQRIAQWATGLEAFSVDVGEQIPGGLVNPETADAWVGVEAEKGILSAPVKAALKGMEKQIEAHERAILARIEAGERPDDLYFHPGDVNLKVLGQPCR